MVNVEDSVIARLKKEGNTFEILVDCEKALEFKQGKIDLDEALVSDSIFKDIKKGEHASEHDLKNIFGTEDAKEVSAVIIKTGEIQLTVEYKQKIRESKKREIIDLIVRNAMDPKTGIPHPPLRIENAMNEVGAKIDEFKNAESQVKDIVKLLTEVLPISYELKKILFTVPAEFTGGSYPIFKRYGRILKEDWKNDGSLAVAVEVPAGLQNKLFDDINHLTQGRVESELMEKKNE
ncbi:ribosome assembly factor SBDS [archaeon]|jgi:ribosome maturation protein SDO1|nr:ribosome assembly factor SBDS [archaeon]